MSSFIGHSITAGAIFLARRKPKEDFSVKGLFWLLCLGLAAIAPDLDYFLPFLQKSNHGGIRVSNSFMFSLIFPSIICVAMLIARVPRDVFRLRATQIMVAGLSHIVLDYLVGVHPLPLFWPFSNATYVSPVGLLPSAGAISLSNFYFYRNLGIELGILIPIYSVVCLSFWQLFRKTKRLLLSLILLTTSLVFMVIAVSLTR